MTKLTEAQLEKGRMVASTYVVDRLVNERVQEAGLDPYSADERVIMEATDHILLHNGDMVLANYGLDDYYIIDNLSTKQYLILEKGNEVKIVFRGRFTDKRNVVDNNHLSAILYSDSIDYSTRRGVLQCNGIGHHVLRRPPIPATNGMVASSGIGRNQMKGLVYDPSKPIDRPLMPLSSSVAAGKNNHLGQP